MRVLRRRTPLTAGFLAFVTLACAAEVTLYEAKQSAAQWVGLRVEAARLESAWREERALVESMATALEERAQATEEKRDLTRAQTSGDRAELEGLREKISAEAGDLQALEAGLRSLTARLQALRPGLPPRLSDALELSYRSLGDEKLGVGERMHVVMTMLNRCAHFNRSVTVGEDVLALEGEATPKSLEVIYWGLSHGYAIDPTTRQAWLGAPVAGSWRWEPQPEAYAAVADLLSIARDQADPRFVAVPATVSRLVEAKGEVRQP